MKILQRIKSKSKALMGLILSGAILAQMFGAGTAMAASPHFNTMSDDYELLTGANSTANQTDWIDPISGNAGETFAGMMYYHNTGDGTGAMPDLTAIDTRLKVMIPAQTTNKKAVLTASISADGVSPVTDTVVNGVVKGKSGLTVNLNEDATLALVPGSVTWYPDWSGTSVPSKPFLFGQTGDELASNSGLRIGDIKVCWQYKGYVTFLFKTTKLAQPQMAVNKTVRNVTLGETTFVKQNFAKPGDILEYQVVATNSGAGTADNLYLTDAIPAGTTYVPGSTIVSVNAGASTGAADGIVVDGLRIGSLAKDQSTVVRFKVKVGNNVANKATLVNTVSLYINKQVLTDTATTIVKFNVTTPVVGGSLPVTGGDSTILTLLVAFSVGLYGVYRKYRKVLLAKTW